ncbi:hypothetical protein PsorP6_011493 [Peronosclerospora sorghi]|uniref:Uncharacterized protein n=1 Tax=Peronosclerospora sorghi TaxID=230839 RepID=A0ACC0WL51_9STRA|nr:hypothetical protein PsorP6_011493 [Peronosclerospora sorghi]
MQIRRGARLFSSSAALHALPTAVNDIKRVLENSIARLESSRALAAFDKLQQDSATHDPQLLQRLALLVAKRGKPHETPRAAYILQHLFSQPTFQVDDATQLAAIYTMDACLRHRRLDDALRFFQAANKKNLVVDLPAIDALLKMLVERHRVDEAVTIMKNVTTRHEVRPTEQTFQAVLFALMQQKRYEEVIELIEHGRKNAVAFSPMTYDPLVDLSEKQYTENSAERLGKFMEYVNNALKMDGYWEQDIDDDLVYVVDVDDGDEFGDDDEFDDGEDFDEFN